jgi:hypothetical protein
LAKAASSNEQRLSLDAFRKKFEHIVSELRGGM